MTVNEGSARRAKSMGYPRSGCSDQELHNVWLRVKKENPELYERVVVAPNLEMEEQEGGRGGYQSLANFLRRHPGDRPYTGIVEHMNLISDMWMFMDLYRNTGTWGGEF